MSKLIDVASSEIGVSEIAGSQHNQRILEYAKEAGFPWYKSDETAWCSVFLNWVANKAGFERSKDARAHSWTVVGKQVDSPLPGDIVLLSSGGTRIYHVGIFTGFSAHGKSVFVLGGNQSNKVSIAPFPLSHVFGYKRVDPNLEGRTTNPEKDPETPNHIRDSQSDTLRRRPQQNTIPLGDLIKKRSSQKEHDIQLPNVKVRYGQRGTPVKQLQEALILLGFLKGRADGIFGIKTARAVQLVQLKGRIRPGGTYNKRTRNYLKTLLIKSA